MLKDFITNLAEAIARLTGQSLPQRNVNQEWQMPSGETETFSEVSKADVDYANEEPGVLSKLLSPKGTSDYERLGTEEELKNWKKVPFTFDEAGGSDSTVQRTGYFIVPSFYRGGDSNYNDIQSVVLDDGTHLDYGKARVFMKNLGENQRYANFQMYEPQPLTGNEYNRNFASWNDLYGKEDNLFRQAGRNKANDNATKIFNLQQGSRLVQLDPITQQHTDNFIEALRKLNNPNGGGGW